MFDQTPVEERHAAIGVFAAIGLAGAGALYLLITGGFAPLAPRIERSVDPAPIAVSVVDAEWAAPDYETNARVTPTSYVPSAVDVADEPLAGAAGDRDAPRSDYARSYDDVASDIDALYAETDVYGEDASYDEPSFEEASYAEDVAFEEDASSKDASAYESESPW